MKSNEAISIAQKEIGVTEYPSGSNKVKYNTWYYGREVSGSKYSWCVVFLMWIFKGTNLLMKTASASTLGNWFKNNKQWYTTPQIGDIVFYNFHTKGKLADHVGIVEQVNADGSIYAIEGNTSSTDKGSQDNGGCVARRKRKANIVGYGRPLYEDAKPASAPTATTPKRATLSEKANSRGADVVYLKKRLTSMGFGNLDLNTDIYNKGCADAVQYLQVTNGLTPDRICGPKTWNLLLN